MDEARRVIARLERIEELCDRRAGRGLLLGELRALVHEGEAWVAAEGEGTARARAAIGELGDALAGRGAADRREEVSAKAPVS